MRDYIELSRKHFNKQAREYDENTSLYYSGYAKISCEDVKAYLKENEYNKLLDIGCGTGWLIDNLSKEHNANHFGLDISENMLEQAKSKNIENATFVLGSSLEPPYEDESFDVVTCIQSFHHYPDSKKAMQEAYRVLKKGGIYILSDTGMGGITAWLGNNIFYKFLNSGDFEVDTKEGISRKMQAVGFSVIRSEKIGKFIYTVVGRK